MEDINGKEVNLLMKALLKKVKELRKEKPVCSTGGAKLKKDKITKSPVSERNMCENGKPLKKKVRKERLD